MDPVIELTLRIFIWKWNCNFFEKLKQPELTHLNWIGLNI